MAKNGRKQKSAPKPVPRAAAWPDMLRQLYEANTPRGHAFRYALLIFDLGTVLFIVGTSFLPRIPLEGGSMSSSASSSSPISPPACPSRKPLRDLMHPATWADVVAIASFLVPLVGEGAGFLRILRTLRLLHTYQLSCACARILLLPPQPGRHHRRRPLCPSSSSS